MASFEKEPKREVTIQRVVPKPETKEPETKEMIIYHQLQEEFEYWVLPRGVIVGDQCVWMLDLVKDMKAFRAQRKILQQGGSEWPAALIGKRWVPLDLRNGLSDTEHLAPANMRMQKQTLASAARAGFKTSTLALKTATESFLIGLAKTLSLRPLQPKPDGLGFPFPPPPSSSKDPPLSEVKISTRTPQREILFAQGYFISTKHGFGFSTPAIRKLPWGEYLFGHTENGEPRFLDTLWTLSEEPLSIEMPI